MNYCAYDGGGNLYVDGRNVSASTGTIGKLPSGSGSFSNITLTEDIEPLSMQWTGSSLLVSSLAHVQSKHGPQPIYEIRISGSNGVVSGPVLLHSPHDMNPYGAVQFWLQGHTLIGPDRVRGGNGLVNFWHYPAGGWPKKIIRRPGHAFGLYGVTMSEIWQALPSCHPQPATPTAEASDAMTLLSQPGIFNALDSHVCWRHEHARRRRR